MTTGPLLRTAGLRSFSQKVGNELSRSLQLVVSICDEKTKALDRTPIPITPARNGVLREKAPSDTPVMGVLEALRRRRMHRFFDGSQLSEETLRTLAWAATRAPTAGNQSSRFLLVVTDPGLIQTIVDVTPGYIGTPPAAFFVTATDLDLAEKQMGTDGRDHLSLIDAGAATENIALAAVALGLGCYLFTSSTAAMAAVLDLPPSVRVEWLAAVGRPSPSPSRAGRAAEQVVYVNRWGGDEWDVGRKRKKSQQ